MHGTGRRWVWAEDLPLSTLSDVSVLRLLQRRGLGLVTSVRPATLEAGDTLVRLVRACHAHDVPISVWPMLDDGDGRWLSAHNTAKFVALCDSLVDRTLRDATPPMGIVFDLEPPIAVVRKLLAGRPPRLPETGRKDDDVLRRAIDRVRAAGLDPWATIVPTILFDTPARPGWQRLLGTPVDGLPFTSVSPMLYTSLLQGYGRGFVRRIDALSWLYASSLRCVRRFGPRASVSLGAIGVGALGDEQTYSTPKELAQDVEVALTAGIEELAVYDLRGVLDRHPAEAWLDAMCRPRPPSPPRILRSWRSVALDGFGLGISHLAALGR